MGFDREKLHASAFTTGARIVTGAEIFIVTSGAIFFRLRFAFAAIWIADTYVAFIVLFTAIDRFINASIFAASIVRAGVAVIADFRSVRASACCQVACIICTRIGIGAIFEFINAIARFQVTRV